jgi:hypothetical protein
MKKIHAVVLKETKYIAVWTLIFSVLLQSVFLIVGSFLPDVSWDYTVLLGNLLGATAALANFFLMAQGVVKAMEKDPKDAKQAMKLSSSMRFLALFIVILIGALLPVFNTWAVAIPLLFPRLAIAVRPLWDKKIGGEDEHEE